MFLNLSIKEYIYLSFFLYVVLSFFKKLNLNTNKEKKDDEIRVRVPSESPVDPNRLFSIDELKKYTGANNGRIYLGCKGYVYDVSDSGFYDFGTTYGDAFSGRDCSIDLAKMDLKVKHDVTIESVLKLSNVEKGILDDWNAKFESKYTIMGKIKNSPFFSNDNDNKNKNKED